MQNLAKACKILQNLAKSCRILQNLAVFLKISWNVKEYKRVHQNPSESHWILQNNLDIHKNAETQIIFHIISGHCHSLVPPTLRKREMMTEITMHSRAPPPTNMLLTFHASPFCGMVQSWSYHYSYYSIISTLST